MDWKWAVVYGDGSRHFEDDLGGWARVQAERVTSLVVYREGDPARHYVVPIRDGARPIFFRRHRRLIDAQTGDDAGGRLFAVCLGWQKTVNGRNVKSMTWLLHDGSVVVSDRDLDDL